VNIQISDEAQALARVEAKLRQLQEQLAELSEQGEEPAYRLGWATGGIKAVLAVIDAWKDDAPVPGPERRDVRAMRLAARMSRKAAQ